MPQTARTDVSALEMVEFRSQEGISADEMLDKASRLHGVLADMDGFIERYLAQGDDGMWVDLVYWRDLASARAAADAVMKIPAAQEFFALIDQESMRFVHLEIRSAFTQRLG